MQKWKDTTYTIVHHYPLGAFPELISFVIGLTFKYTCVWKTMSNREALKKNFEGGLERVSSKKKHSPIAWKRPSKPYKFKMLGEFQKFQEICNQMSKRIFKTDGEMSEIIEPRVCNPQNSSSRNGPNLSHPWNHFF